MINITLRATNNMDDNVSISIQKGLKNDLTLEGFTLQLLYSKTTFEITFNCVIITIAFFGCFENLAAIGTIIYYPKYHTPTFAAIGQLALADFLSISTLNKMTNFWQISNRFVIIVNTFIFSSYFHVCLLSAVRYLITVYPLQSRQHLTVTAV